MVLNTSIDLIAMIALLGTARFFTVLAGLDVGTPFGGLGASREMFISSISEPAILMVIFSLSLLTHTTLPTQMVIYILEGHIGIQVSVGLTLVAMVMIAIAENGRIPVDNPTTHLELTMIHEGMLLEYSGSYLALMEAANMVRLLLFMSIISCLFFPWGIADSDSDLIHVLFGLIIWAFKVGILSMILGCFETALIKMRFFQISDFLGGALLFALLATLFLYISEAV
jgi:formate hydrogenlyase subunit 4